jgi:putative transposase
VIDVFIRRIVGWRVSSTFRAELALDALEMAIPSGGQRRSMAWSITATAAFSTWPSATPRLLAEAGAVRSVGSRGDRYDNALAESVVGLFKTELIRKKGPWRTHEQVELATARRVDWYNNRRLHSSIGRLPPAEFEAAYDAQCDGSAVA